MRSLIALLALLVGCAPVTAVIRAPGTSALPTHPSEVRIYLDAQQAPPGYQELGLVLANTHVFVPVMFNLDALIAEGRQTVRSGNQADHPVLWALVRKAAALGADGVILTGLHHLGTTLSMSGVAIRSAPRRTGSPPCPPPPAP